jgi:hypothetical protein
MAAATAVVRLPQPQVGTMPQPSRWSLRRWSLQRRDRIGVMGLILIIVVLVLLFGGGGGYYAHRSYGLPGLGGVVGLIIVVLLLLWLFGGLRL